MPLVKSEKEPGTEETSTRLPTVVLHAGSTIKCLDKESEVGSALTGVCVPGTCGCEQRRGPAPESLDVSSAGLPWDHVRVMACGGGEGAELHVPPEGLFQEARGPGS